MVQGRCEKPLRPSASLRAVLISMLASLTDDFVLRKRCFPIRHRTGQKQFFGFQTGDIVKAVVPKGKKVGTHIGRVMIRATGSFDIRTKSGRMQGINQKYCRIIQRSDGYNYQAGAPIPLP